MAKVLYITANPKSEETSFSLSVGRAFLDAYQSEHPNDEVTLLDLYQAGIPHIDADVFSGWGKLATGSEFGGLDAEEQRKVARLGELSDQFVAHDVFVFVTPVWNFLFPPIVKAYVDSICVAGKTFKYTEQGPIGLLPGKTAVHIQASGGILSNAPGNDFGGNYLQAVMGFVGITDVHRIYVEGMAQMPDRADEFKAKAIAEAQRVAKSINVAAKA
ncbi:MAG: FMN-dependent NADH-azoreductase [Tumebacillaceae bacterium]